MHMLRRREPPKDYGTNAADSFQWRQIRLICHEERCGIQLTIQGTPDLVDRMEKMAQQDHNPALVA